MTKFWLLEEKHTQLVIISDSHIHIAKNGIENKFDLALDIEKGIIPKNMFSIPHSYINKVENRIDGEKIKIAFNKDGSEHIVIQNNSLKHEIFETLKNQTSDYNYKKKKPSIFTPQLFSILFLTGIYLIILFYLTELEKGNEYVIHGRGGIMSLILGLAYFGTTKITSVYLILLSLAIFSLFKKEKKRTLTEYLIKNKF